VRVSVRAVVRGGARGNARGRGMPARVGGAMRRMSGCRRIADVTEAFCVLKQWCLERQEFFSELTQGAGSPLADLFACCAC
jgi:hypothetical protein